MSAQHAPGPRPTDFPDRAPEGYVWAIAEVVPEGKGYRSYLRTRPELGRFWLTQKLARPSTHGATATP
jgi:hypothetical protein